MGRKKKRENEREETEEEIERKIILPGEEECLGVITRFMGGSNVEIYCSDGQLRMCRIPGRMRRRVWMREGDIVLVALWSFQPSRGDIIHRYTSSQVNWLKKKKYLDFAESVTSEL